MHIVFVSREYVPSLRGGGIASYVKDMANGLVSAGHTVTVICASDDTKESSDNIEEKGLRIIRLSGGDFIVPQIEGNNILKKFRCIYRFHSYRKKILKTILSLGKVDIIEVPEFGAEGYYLMDIKIPVVVRLHTPSFLDRATFGKKKYSILNFYEYWCAKQEEKVTKKAKYITSCSESLKKWIVKYFEVRENLIDVIYNPIRVSDWTGNRIESKKDCINILFVGTVAEEKGVGDLIDACDILVNKGYNIQLQIAGKLGKYGLYLESVNKNKQWCIFLGNVNRYNLKKLYKSNDIICIPSWWDNLPIVCLEAMASGCVVIASDSGGMCEIIDDRLNGYFIQPKQYKMLSNKIEEIILLDNSKVSLIRDNAVKKIKDKFDFSVIMNQMTDYYNKIIEEHENTLD